MEIKYYEYHPDSDTYEKINIQDGLKKNMYLIEIEFIFEQKSI